MDRKTRTAKKIKIIIIIYNLHRRGAIIITMILCTVIILYRDIVVSINIKY
jgi:hypothetical protein